MGDLSRFTTHNLASRSTASSSSLSNILESHCPNLTPYESLYKHFHSHPELSHQEEQTAATVAFHLRQLSSSFKITEHIGGHGLVAVLENGHGKTVLLRADTDALPVQEKTGLPYASTVTMKDDDGIVKPVMHACGHDMHVTSMLAAAELLLSARDEWSGTLIIVFQPAEERGAGAKAMVDDGFYSKGIVPIPDVVLGQHVMPFKAGIVGVKRGLMASAADSFKVTIYGKGGHASQPHRTIDPVVVAAGMVIRLQTIVSRECPPDEMVALTVGSLQAGMTENIIPDMAELKVNVRTVRKETRKKVLDSVFRIIKAECVAGGCEQEPLVERSSEFPFTVNDDEATLPIEETFADYFGESFKDEIDRLLGSEDFSIFGTAVQRPCCFWVVGMTDPELWEEEVVRKGKDIPINHSPYFAPVLQPTLKVSVDAMALAALTFMAKR